MAAFTATGSVATSWPLTRTAPLVGSRKPVIIFMVVDLPAPLGPRKPNTSPRRTEKETLRTAWMGPKRLSKASTSMAGVCGSVVIALFR